jgi:hypothetical protein
MDDIEVDGARQRFTFIEPRRRVAAVTQNRIEYYRATRALYPHDIVANVLFFFFIRVCGVEQLHGLCRHDRRDSVFIDQLGMGVAAQQHTEIVKPGDNPLQFDAIYEKYGYRQLVLADVIKEYILYVLRFFRCHFMPRYFVVGIRIERIQKCPSIRDHKYQGATIVTRYRNLRRLFKEQFISP